MGPRPSPAVVKVVGSLNWDIINFVQFHDGVGTHRTFVDEEELQCPGGHGANQAVAVYRAAHEKTEQIFQVSGSDRQSTRSGEGNAEFPLVVDVYMIGMIGGADGDKRGEQIKEMLSNIGVKVEGIKTEDTVKTGYAHVDIDERGKPSVGNKLLANNYLLWGAVQQQLENTPVANLILVQMEIPEETVRETIKYANDRRIPIIFNPAPVPGPGVDLYDDKEIFNVDHLILNKDCAENICRPNERYESVSLEKLSSVAEIQKRYSPMCDYLHKLGATCVVITLGYRGVIASYLEPPDAREKRSQRSFFYGAKRGDEDVTDETGASDAFIGAYAVEILRQMDARKQDHSDNIYDDEALDIGAAIEIGIKAGGLTTAGKGSLPSIPWRDRLVGRKTKWLSANPFPLNPKRPENRRSYRS